MREEAERVIGEEGWTKAALNNMTKIDSFLRESQRHNPTGPRMYPIHAVFICVPAEYAAQWSCSAGSFQRTASDSPTVPCCLTEHS
jgi:hypothetical protein